MITATGQTASGINNLIVGLSFPELEQLRELEVVKVDGRPYAFDNNILMFAERDENVMLSLLRGVAHCKPETIT